MSNLRRVKNREKFKNGGWPEHYNCRTKGCTSFANAYDMKCDGDTVFKNCRVCGKKGVTWEGYCWDHSRKDPWDGLCKEEDCPNEKAPGRRLCEKHDHALKCSPSGCGCPLANDTEEDKISSSITPPTSYPKPDEVFVTQSTPETPTPIRLDRENNREEFKNGGWSENDNCRVYGCTSYANAYDMKCDDHTEFKNCEICGKPGVSWEGYCLGHSRMDPWDGLCKIWGCPGGKLGGRDLCEKHNKEKEEKDRADRKRNPGWMMSYD
jgi:hypothetical protein